MSVCMELVKHRCLNSATLLRYDGGVTTAGPSSALAARPRRSSRARRRSWTPPARLGGERGIRQVTLTDIADAVGMHKSALLRYFETREEIFLRLTADGWREWTPALRDRAWRTLPVPTPAGVAAAFAATLAARGHVLRPARPGAR